MSIELTTFYCYYMDINYESIPLTSYFVERSEFMPFQGYEYKVDLSNLELNFFFFLIWFSIHIAFWQGLKWVIWSFPRSMFFFSDRIWYNPPPPNLVPGILASHHTKRKSLSCLIASVTLVKRDRVIFPSYPCIYT